jgi:hypothetical protein
VSQPQQWQLSDGGSVSVVTPNSQPLADIAAVAAELLEVSSVPARLKQLQRLTSAVSCDHVPHVQSLSMSF